MSELDAAAERPKLEDFRRWRDGQRTRQESRLLDCQSGRALQRNRMPLGVNESFVSSRMDEFAYFGQFTIMARDRKR